jgi:hypothetical protein
VLICFIILGTTSSELEASTYIQGLAIFADF